MMKANELLQEGYKYECGNDCSRNFEKAIENYIKAGENGEGEGYYRAGLCFQFYIGNIEKAVEYYVKGHEAGSANATFCLGNCYYDGIGVERDTIKGCTLRNEALKKESPVATNWFISITKQR